MQTITKIGPKSCANMYAFFLAVSMFVTGFSIGIANIFQRFAEGGLTLISTVLMILVNLAFGALVGLLSALFAAIIGYIAGYVLAWLYNRAVRFKLLGGIKIEMN